MPRKGINLRIRTRGEMQAESNDPGVAFPGSRSMRKGLKRFRSVLGPKRQAVFVAHFFHRPRNWNTSLNVDERE